MSKRELATRREALAVGALLLHACPGVGAQRVKPAYESNYRVVRAMLEQPEAGMDLARIKVTVDKMVDPADTEDVLSRLDLMAGEIMSSLPLGASNLARLKALRDYLY